MEKSKSSMGIMIAVIVAIVIGAVVYFVSASDDSFALDVNFNNLAPLDQGVYEGWVVRGDVKYSFGTFNMNEDGEVVGEFDFVDSDFSPEDGDMVVITIEPVPDADPGPSTVVVLAGELGSSSSDLTFPIDTSAFTGQYILATPTNDPDEFEAAGVWFLDPSGPSPTLNLPDAPAGWVYEGWVVYNGETPISTGKFVSASGADMFNGYSGSAGAPPFPGEDLIRDLPNGLTGPLVFNDGKSVIVISIEPDIDGTDPTGPGPAQVKPLSAVVADGAADHVLFDLANNSDVPSGSVSLL